MFGYGMGLLGWLWMVVLWVAVIAFVVWLVRRTGGYCGHGYHEHRDSAIEILKERYAKGEISKEEFESKKKDLAH